LCPDISDNGEIAVWLSDLGDEGCRNVPAKAPQPGKITVMGWRRRAGVLSLKVAVVGLVVPLIGFAVWLIALRSDDTSNPAPSGGQVAPERPSTAGPVGTLASMTNRPIRSRLTRSHHAPD